MLVTDLRDKIKAMFSDLVFEDRRHLYFVGGMNYVSVSSLVESHAEKFDTEKMLPLSAKKEGRDIEELRQEWIDKRDNAAELGSDTHNFLEEYNGTQAPTTPYEEAGIKFLNDISQEYEIVFKELRMYSRKYLYAGTGDLLLMHRLTGDLAVADYKTNAELFKQYKYQRLLPPFDFLDATPYNKYQVQVSYYQIMLEEINCFIKRRILVHLKPDATYRPFDLVDLTPYLIDCLESKKKVAYDKW